ncbi:MAG: hypothetical protein RR814_02570 [Oscillospiraceae bacterium]
MTWDMYYERFYDWAESTQTARIASIESFGVAEEVTEIADALTDEKAASKLIMKAISHGVVFSFKQIEGLCGCVDEKTIAALLSVNKEKITAQQLETLADYIDEDVLVKLVDENKGDFTYKQLETLADYLPNEDVIDDAKIKLLIKAPHEITTDILRNIMEQYYNAPVLEEIARVVPLNAANQKIIEEDFTAFDESALIVMFERLCQKGATPNAELFRDIISEINEKTTEAIYENVKGNGNKKAVDMLAFALGIENGKRKKPHTILNAAAALAIVSEIESWFKKHN